MSMQISLLHACLIDKQIYHTVEVYFLFKYICTPLDFQ